MTTFLRCMGMLLVAAIVLCGCDKLKKTGGDDAGGDEAAQAGDAAGADDWGEEDEGMAGAPATDPATGAPAPAGGAPAAPKVAAWQTDYVAFTQASAKAVAATTSSSPVGVLDAQFMGREVTWKLKFSGYDAEKETIAFKGVPSMMRFEPAPIAVSTWEEMAAGASVTVKATIASTAVFAMDGKQSVTMTLKDARPVE